MSQRFSRTRDRVPGVWRAALVTFLVAGVVAAWAPAAAASPGTPPGSGAVQGTVGAKTAAGKVVEPAAKSYGSRSAADDASGALATILTKSLHGGYVSAGVGMRNQGSGTISISGIPDGATVES